MEKQEKNCRPDNLYYCGIVLPLAGILFLALLRLLKIPLNHILTLLSWMRRYTGSILAAERKCGI